MEVIILNCAANDNVILPGEQIRNHVIATAPAEEILQISWVSQKCDMASARFQVVISKQLLRTVTGAIDHNILRQPFDLATVGKFFCRKLHRRSHKVCLESRQHNSRIKKPRLVLSSDDIESRERKPAPYE